MTTTLERPDTATERFVGADDVADVLGLRLSTVREFARRAHDPIPSYRLGRARRYRISEAVAWAEAQGGK